MINHYDIIYISESGFQEKVVEYLITHIYKNETYLWVKSQNGCFVDNEGKQYKIDLNHARGIVKSIPFIFKFPKLSCQYLIGTQFTGINCRYFESVINYKELHLMDDGIGTPVITSYPNYYSHFPKEQFKMAIVRSVLFLKFKKLKSTKQLIEDIQLYYTVYPLKQSYKKEIHLNFLEYDYRLIKNTGFIGMPLVDYRMVSEKHFTLVLKSLIKKYGNLDYYPDPNETWINKQNIEGLKIIEKNEPLEIFLKRNGLPKKMYTFTSSALLNLKVADKRMEGYYIKIPDGGDIRSYYYSIFESFGLKEYSIDV